MLGTLVRLRDVLAVSRSSSVDNGRNAVATLLDSGIFAFLLSLMTEQID